MCRASLDGRAPSPPAVRATNLEGRAPSRPAVGATNLEGRAPSRPAVCPRRAGLLAALLPAAILLASAAVAGQKAPPKAKPKPKPADNSYCAVCHANLKSELLVKKHQPAGVGCTTCHGESDKHSSDENNITPPDIMYAKENIAAACMKCHPASGWKKPEMKTIHAPYRVAKPSANACTSCHGAHRLPVRTRRWDKVTRKLIKDDGVRMLPESGQDKR